MRPPTLRSAKKRAWKAFSRFIIARDKRCITCPTGKAENAGHFHHNVLDFDEKNIHAQCYRCNHYLSGNLAVYAEYLIKTYGVKEFRALSKRRYLALKGEKRSIDDYLAIEAKYKTQ